MNGYQKIKEFQSVCFCMFLLFFTSKPRAYRHSAIFTLFLRNEDCRLMKNCAVFPDLLVKFGGFPLV